MVVRVQVESAVLDAGAKRALMEPISIAVQGATLRVSELIRLGVEQQVVRLHERRVEAEEIRRLLNRQYLRQEDVDRLQARGEVRTNARKRTGPSKEVDLESEVRLALAAYERGTFMIYVNGAPAGALGEAVEFPFDSKVVFLRLTPLVGG